jgi:hypothetical protein
VDEHSCRVGDKTWRMCRWNYPRCNVTYPFDQVLFGFTEGAVATIDILGKPGQIMVDEIGNQCHYSVGIELPRLGYC